MIGNVDFKLDHHITHTYIDDETNKTIKEEIFTEFSDIITARRPQIGESITIRRKVKTYQKVDLEKEYERQKNIERPFSKEEPKIEKPGFFTKIVHEFKENMKEMDSEENRYYVYEIVDIVHNLYGQNNETVFYVKYKREF